MIVRKHVIVARNRDFRLDLADKIGSLPMRKVVEASIDDT